MTHTWACGCVCEDAPEFCDPHRTNSHYLECRDCEPTYSDMKRGAQQ